MKVHLGGQRFQTGDRPKYGMWNWLCSKDKTFCSAGTSNLPRAWGKKYVSVNGKYVVKE
jgi:hypothetical protein